MNTLRIILPVLIASSIVSCKTASENTALEKAALNSPVLMDCDAETPELIRAREECIKDNANRQAKKDTVFVCVEREPRFRRRGILAYPPEGRGLESKVLAQVLIDTTGKAIQVKFLSGNSLFFDACTQFVMTSDYCPALQGGKPVKVWMTLPLSFKTQ